MGIRELSLYSGSGGGILASLLLGHTIIGAVEYDEQCCKVLEQRQAEGCLTRFPIFQVNIQYFVRGGYAALYTGVCDLLSGGFPCQPFSNAGRRAGEDDERNLWPITIECIRIIRPRRVFLENVPGLLSAGDDRSRMRYYGRILGDLAESGFDVGWKVLSAAELGAPHKRDRLWIAADATR